MTKEQFEKLSAPVKRAPWRVLVLRFFDRIITILTAVMYVALIIYFFWTDKQQCYQCVLIPAVAFFVVSLYRNVNHSKRPYEIYDIEPLIHKSTKEKSFPSRHVFSIFIIAMTYLRYLPPVGITFMAAGVLLAIIRVIAGVHFPKDVICGAALGIFCGLFYWIIF